MERAKGKAVGGRKCRSGKELGQEGREGRIPECSAGSSPLKSEPENSGKGFKRGSNMIRYAIKSNTERYL